MKITIVIGPYFPVPTVLGGGVEKVHLALAEEFVRRGHSVTMISRAYGGFPRDEVQAGVRHLRVESRDAPRSRIRFQFFDLLYARRVARVLPESDITITNGFFLPIVLAKRRAGHLYVHVARYPKGQMWLYHRVDRIQAVSAHVAEAIRRQTPTLADRIVAIPPPLVGPLAAVLPLDRLGMPRSRTILYVGRIAKEKGVHALVTAFAGLAKGPLAGYKLRIVGPHEVRQGGDGPEYVRSLNRLAGSAADAISFDGFIPDVHHLRHIYETADIFVYPSLAERGESFGAAPLEAMAAGCRVLVSNLACFREYLEPGRNGLIFDHRRQAVASLTAALKTMVSDADPHSMREAAVATAARFQLAPIATRLLHDFARVIAEPRSRPTTAAVPAVAPPQSGDMLTAPHVVSKQRLRITFALGPYFPVPLVLGGVIERIQLALAQEYAFLGHQVTIISRCYADFPREEVVAGVRHLRVASRNAPSSFAVFQFYDLVYARRVAAVLPESDVTVTNSLFLPLVLPRRRAGHIYIRVGRYPKGQMWLYLHADRIQTSSTYIAAAVRRQTPILASRIIVIPPPLIGPLAPPMPSPASVQRLRNILFVGRIAKEKGIHHLVEAFVREARGALSGYRLDIVGSDEFRHGGDGPEYLRRLQELAAPAGDAVSFRGFVSEMSELRRLYESSDIFVYPSIAEKGEAFGVAPLEAMAAGCRVLVSDLGCFREYVEPGRNARVFDHRHDPVGSLAAALRAMAADADDDAMREAAVATTGRFQLGPIATRLLEDFVRVVNEAKPGC